MRRPIPAFLCFLAFAFASMAFAAELRPPDKVFAGANFAIHSSGSGQATFYLIGPAQVSKRKIDLGSDIAVHGAEVEKAGRYTAIVCASDQCDSANFDVRPDQASRVSLLVHPSRVRVASPNAISAVAFVFDKFRNMLFSPQTLEFSVIPPDGKEISTTRPTENGISWIRLTSATKEGPAKIGVKVGNTEEVRVVRQVASEACNLRISANWVDRKLWVQTDPVRDCSGNAVSDGTIVSFTKVDSSGKTTVDAPIKRGIAKVQMPVQGGVRISVASGVVTGNEIPFAGGR
jgi:hypothetical protein